MILYLLLTQVQSFDYLSAIVHSQDVSPVSHRELWHPHLYLAKDSSGDFYEIRHSSQYYDVSISFLQTSSEDPSPGVMNCECRFVKEEVEEEEETNFLQVMTPSKVKPKVEQRDKEISIGAFVPKQKEFEYSPQVTDFQTDPSFSQVRTVVRQENPREEHLNEAYKGPEIIVIQGYPELKGIQNQGFNQGNYQSGYQATGFNQNNFGNGFAYQGSTYNAQSGNLNQGNTNQQAYAPSYSPTYTNTGYSQGYINQPVYNQPSTQGQGFIQGYQTTQPYVQGQTTTQVYPQSQEYVQSGYFSQYIPQNNYVQQPVVVSGFNQPQYVQEYPNQMQQVPQVQQIPQVQQVPQVQQLPQVIQVPQVNYQQQGFLQTKY